MRTVSVYSEAGWQRDVASLNQGRFIHACSTYINGGKKVNLTLLYHTFHTYVHSNVKYQIIMVTGGIADTGPHRHLDDTEIFTDNIWRTVAAKLPVLMYGLSVATINNRVLAFGNS